MTKQPARIQVKETERYYRDLEGSLESIIALLQADLDAGWEGIENEYEQYSDYHSPFLYKHREETDKEYDKRMKEIEKQKAEKLKEKKGVVRNMRNLRKNSGTPRKSAPKGLTGRHKSPIMHSSTQDPCPQSLTTIVAPSIQFLAFGPTPAMVGFILKPTLTSQLLS